MVTGEQTMTILVLAQQGKSIRAISRELEINRKTVRRCLRRPETASVYGPRPRRGSKLDPFKEGLRRRIAEASPRWIPATVHLREIRRQGYSGGITTLRLWLARERPKEPEEPVVRFETPPGHQAQVDWAQFRGGADRLSAFVCVLGHSRYAFVRFVPDERLETLLDAHERFFEAAGGVPCTLLYDNMKTVVVHRNAYGPGEHRLNAGFREFAKHHGFLPRLCRPRRAQTKGKVERFIRYLRESFYVPLEARLRASGEALDVARANAEVSAWLRDVANERTHGETKRVVSEAFAEERGHLQPLCRPWGGLKPSHPSAAAYASVRQHSLSVYDEFGRAA